jgi:hypothetical protein
MLLQHEGTHPDPQLPPKRTIPTRVDVDPGLPGAIHTALTEREEGLYCDSRRSCATGGEPTSTSLSGPRALATKTVTSDACDARMRTLFWPV